jgi:hypothetical protein
VRVRVRVRVGVRVRVRVRVSVRVRVKVSDWHRKTRELEPCACTMRLFVAACLGHTV